MNHIRRLPSLLSWGCVAILVASSLPAGAALGRSGAPAVGARSRVQAMPGKQAAFGGLPSAITGARKPRSAYP